MSMFDYSCGKCNHKFEELVISSTTPDNEIQCPECKEFQSNRQLSAPAVSVGYSDSSPSASSGCGAPAGSGFG